MSKFNLNNTISEAKAGSQMAYTDLLNQFWGDINRFLNAKCNDEYEAEDLTIKTFSRAFDKLDLYDSQYPFKNWLLTISNNLYIDYFRSQKNALEELDIEKEQVFKIPDDALSPEDQLIQEQQLAELLHHIKNLKPHYREIINLRYFQEYSLKEIAEEMDEPMSNVKVKLLRARKLLSELIHKNKNL
jgi:RNA polymerase sigma factor (sigma-70 family)